MIRITGQPVSRVKAGVELVVYVALIKGAEVAPAAVTRAAGGEVPGVTVSVTPGRQATIERAEIRFGQRTAGGTGRAEPLRASLTERGFTDPIDVVGKRPVSPVARN